MERIIVPVLSAEAVAAVSALVSQPDLEVIAVAADLGQGPGLDELHTAALAAGAARCHAFDLRARLAGHFLWPALRAGALAVPGEPVVTALSAPCIAEAVAEIVRLEQATAVGAYADDPRDRQRLHAALRDLAPATGLVALPPIAVAGPTRNLWARVEPWAGAASRPARAEATPAARVTVRIERGLPVALSGVTLTPDEIIESLTTLAHGHGVGPVAVRDRDQAWLVDAPAADVLGRASAAVVARTVDDRTLAVAEGLSAEYASLVRDGRWFGALRRGLDAFASEVLTAATGDVTVTLFDGVIEVQA